IVEGTGCSRRSRLLRGRARAFRAVRVASSSFQTLARAWTVRAFLCDNRLDLAMTKPATPSPAATLVLLRDRAPSAVEVLLLQRHAKSKFAAGDYVFAGGKIEADDMPSDGERFCRGLTAE